jgi:hypothetical protein
MGDFNNNVTGNSISSFFESMNLVELILMKHGIQAPNIFAIGSQPIDGIFGSRELAPLIQDIALSPGERQVTINYCGFTSRRLKHEIWTIFRIGSLAHEDSNLKIHELLQNLWKPGGHMQQQTICYLVQMPFNNV